MSELIQRLRERADDSGYHADFTAAANRITELEAQQQSYAAMIDLLKEQHAIDRDRLADSNEALQVMGLKLAQAEGHSANTVGEREACPACGDDVEHVWCLISPEGKRFTGDTKMAAYREEASSRIPATEQLANIMRANAECEAEYQADLEQARKQGYQSGYAAGLEVNSANTVGGPTPGAAPACEPERSVSESIAAGHPCFDPDGPPDHDWEYVDDSFSHEFGTEICGHYECARCNAIKPE